MAKSRRGTKKNRRYSPAQRELHQTARRANVLRSNRRELFEYAEKIPHFYSPVAKAFIEGKTKARGGIRDRRTWHPFPDSAPLISQTGVTQRINRKIYRNSRNFFPPDRDGFASPKRQDICHKRRARRRLLFKQGKAGKGIKGPKRRVMGMFSKVRC